MQPEYQRLGKRAVERLLAEVESAGDDVDALRDAVADHLATVVGRPGAGWIAVVDDAAALAGWGRERWAALRLAATPERLDGEQLAATRDALWDLAAELNERRQLAR